MGAASAQQPAGKSDAEGKTMPKPQAVMKAPSRATHEMLRQKLEQRAAATPQAEQQKVQSHKRTVQPASVEPAIPGATRKRIEPLQVERLVTTPVDDALEQRDTHAPER